MLLFYFSFIYLHITWPLIGHQRTSNIQMCSKIIKISIYNFVGKFKVRTKRLEISVVFYINTLFIL